MSLEKEKFDLAKAVMVGMTLDDLLDIPLALVHADAVPETQPVVLLPPYKPSIQLADNDAEIVKPKLGKPQVTVNIPIEHHKHQHFGCELCGQSPKFMCSSCKEAYYCCEKHCLLDFHAIHKFVCVKLMIVRNPDVKHVQWRRFSKEEIVQNIQMRKVSRKLLKLLFLYRADTTFYLLTSDTSNFVHSNVILLHVANNMSQRHLARGNYSFAIPCSLLAQKLVNEMHGLHCVQMIKPYLVMADAYLARSKLERSKFYTGLISYIKTDKMNNSLPKHLEMAFQRTLAKQLIYEKKYDEAKMILSAQIADICLQNGLDCPDLFPAIFEIGNCSFLSSDLVTTNAFYNYFLQQLSASLLREVVQTSFYIHQCIEEDLNPEVRQDKKLGLLQKPNCRWAHVMSQKVYEVYIRRETVLTYLRTIWIQFETANRNDFPDIFPSLLYCVAMTLVICRQWSEACEMYSDAVVETSADRQTDFREIQSTLSVFHRHISHRMQKQGIVDGEKENQIKDKQQCASPVQPLWRRELVKFDVSELPNEENELGLTLQRIVKKIERYKTEIKIDHDNSRINRKVELQQMGLI